MAKLYIVGIGPGNSEHLSVRARKVLEEVDVVIGYKTYIKIILPIIGDKEHYGTSMMQEIDRAKMAIEEAKSSKSVALVSSGDAGIYGMASLVFDLIKKQNITDLGFDVEVVPGITAANAAASLIGAPLGHDTCLISLSDLLTPWESIKRKIQLAAEADFVVVFYNPASKKRTEYIKIARDILMEARGQNVPVGIINKAYRDGQSIILSDLRSFLGHEIGMETTVIVGNSKSYKFENWMVTPRGYGEKYNLPTIP